MFVDKFHYFLSVDYCRLRDVRRTLGFFPVLWKSSENKSNSSQQQQQQQEDAQQRPEQQQSTSQQQQPNVSKMFS